MATYESYVRTVGMIHTVLVDQMLESIAFKQYEHESGHSIRETLPEKHDEFGLNINGFEGYVDPNRRAFENPEYKGRSLTIGRIAANPEPYFDLVDDLYDLWWETFGEWHRMAKQPDHPGEPQMDKDDLSQALVGLRDSHIVLCEDPSLDDLLGAIRDKNYRLAAQFLDLDNAQEMFNPGGGHELSALFTNGEIHIVYQDDDIALLKPEYDHERWAEIASQRLPRGRFVTVTGNPPEEAFVVGIDDTPTGLFAHSVDGTFLSEDQSVSRETLHDVMNFDYNYQHEDVLSLSEGDRVRLQGDLAVRLVTADVPTDVDAGRCNLPIDNHLAILRDADFPDGEDLSEEPVRVVVPEPTVLNIVHDEHEQVAATLPAGAYEFYLLRRGIQPRDERPEWPDQTAPTPTDTI